MADLKKLVIKPTVFCYHKCPYCDLRQEFYSEMLAVSRETVRQSKPGHMPFDMAVKQIEEAYELGMRECLFSGGDPLLYPQIRELIEVASSFGDVFVFMNSVGTGLTHEKATSLLDAGLQAWNFSVDTLDPKMYDKIRGIQGAFGQIMDAIKVLREVRSGNSNYAKFYINYMTVITRYNFRQLPSIIDHCLKHDIDSIFLMNVYGDEKEKAFLLSKKEIEEFRRQTVPELLSVIDRSNVEECVKANAQEVLLSFYSPDNSDENYSNGIWWDDFKTVKQTCKVPEYYSLVEADGNVLPCCLVEISHEGVVGNIKSDNLQTVWNGDGYKNFRENRIEFCQRCPVPKHRTLGFVPELCCQFVG